MVTPRARANNGMHPTTDTTALMYINGSGRRVMPGVRLLSLPWPDKVIAMTSILRLTILFALSASCTARAITQSKEPRGSSSPPEERQPQVPEEERVYTSKEVDVKARVTNKMAHIPEAGRDCPGKGWVRLRAVLHRSGEVTEVALTKGLGCSFDEEAIKVVRRYKFTPALKGSRPVSQYQLFEFRYTFF